TPLLQRRSRARLRWSRRSSAADPYSGSDGSYPAGTSSTLSDRNRLRGTGRSVHAPASSIRHGNSIHLEEYEQTVSERNRPEVPTSGEPPLVRALRSILFIQGLRAALYGFGSVLIGSFLRVAGFSDVQVGLVFTAMLAGMALSSVVVGVVGDRFGRRRCYAVLLLVMGVAGAVYALSDWFPALLIAALTGTLSTDPNESGPITSLEQAMIGEASPETRLSVFGR